MAKKDLIINNIQNEDVVVGFSSYGQATYESEYNGGMGSNGLTSARHDLLAHKYADKYPESFDPNTDRKYVYCGSKDLTDKIVIDDKVGEVNLGKLILSPTRTYLPLLKKIIKEKIPINGIIHCTGGAQTKVLKFVNEKHIVKDNLLAIPPLFKLIESEFPIERKEMYEVFNMGHRLEIYTAKDNAKALIGLASPFNIEAQIIGHVENSKTNRVTIIDENNVQYEYE